jgi:hypothetical protein
LNLLVLAALDYGDLAQQNFVTVYFNPIMNPDEG